MYCLKAKNQNTFKKPQVHQHQELYHQVVKKKSYILYTDAPVLGTLFYEKVDYG